MRTYRACIIALVLTLFGVLMFIPQVSANEYVNTNPLMSFPLSFPTSSTASDQNNMFSSWLTGNNNFGIGDNPAMGVNMIANEVTPLMDQSFIQMPDSMMSSNEQEAMNEQAPYTPEAMGFTPQEIFESNFE